MTNQEFQSQYSFEQILKDNQGYIYTLVKQMPLCERYADDYTQEARISLWDSYISYDPSIGPSFMAYAGVRIKWKLIAFMQNSINVIKTRPQQQIDGITTRFEPKVIISGDSHYTGDSGEESNDCFFDTISDDLNLEEVVISKMEFKSKKQALNKAIQELKPSYQEIVQLKLNGISDVGIAKKMKVTKQRIGQVKRVINKKLRNKLLETELFE